MLILVAFAFLAGIFTALSPCVLPVLPALLGASTARGRLRPLGIITGLVISFSFFTLALTAIVQLTGLSPDILRVVAIVIIALFGVVMIFPSLSGWFAKVSAPIGDAGQRLQSEASGSGFGSGVLFGCALGLLWTPCAGPILAAITTLVATQMVTWTAIIMTLSYSLGAAVPFFIIAYGSSRLLQSSKYLSRYSERIRQGFGVVMLLTAVAIALHWDTILQQRLIDVVPAALVEDNSLVRTEIEKLQGQGRASSLNNIGMASLGQFGAAPDFVGITNWINTPPLTLEQLRDKVVLVDFWTYSCINCLRTLPYIEKWYAEYKDKGLVIVGVHTPEFEFEKDPSNVEAAAKRLGIRYPIAQDNNYKTWLAYNNRYWPAHYLIDQKGELRAFHFGEGGYVETENQIRELLGLPPLNAAEPYKVPRRLTPETYLGRQRADRYTPENDLIEGKVENYHYKIPLVADQIGLKGLWKAEGERITSQSDDSQLDLSFTAKQVYLVLGGRSASPMEVYLDGKRIADVHIDGDRKYDVANADYGLHSLSLKVPKGVSVYAFTFGDD